MTIGVPPFKEIKKTPGAVFSRQGDYYKKRPRENSGRHVIYSAAETDVRILPLCPFTYVIQMPVEADASPEGFNELD